MDVSLNSAFAGIPAFMKSKFLLLLYFSKFVWRLLAQIHAFLSGFSKEFKKGNRVSFWTLCLTLWGGCHIERHVWMWVIVPLDLAQSFGAVCAYYRYRVIYRAITYACVSDLSPHGKGNSHLVKLLGGLSYEKSGGTITHLHTWWQDDYHNRLPL